MHAEGKSRTAAKHLTLLRMLLSWAVRRDLIDKDPSTGLKAPRHIIKEHRVPTARAETTASAVWGRSSVHARRRSVHHSGAG